MTRLLLAGCLMIALGAAARAQDEGEDAVPGLIAPGGLVLFYGTTGPLSYPTLTPRDVPAGSTELGTVQGKSCQRGLSIPIFGLRGPNLSGAAGKGGFEQALAGIRKEHPDLKGIYDVKVDERHFSILGIYRKVCTEVSARGFK